MYLSHLGLKNIRCFRSCSLDLPNPKENGEMGNVTLILGDNGSGKTTILKAMALAALTPIIKESGYRAYHMIREKKETGSLKASLYLGYVDAVATPHHFPTALAFNRVGDNESMDPNLEEGFDLPLDGNLLNGRSVAGQTMRDLYNKDFHHAYFMAGYGATRRMETGDYKFSAIKQKRSMRYHRVASLFEDEIALLPLSAWFEDIGPLRQEEVLTYLNALIPEGNVSFRQDSIQSEYTLVGHGLATPYSALSDGYRAFLAWATDLLGNMCLCLPADIPLKKMEGLVLVDEVDLHLHPEWQMEVIERISTTFPNLQFVFTSHSPIVAGTLQAKQIFHAVKDENGVSLLTQGTEEIRGRSADQILVSPYFGLKTTRAKGVRRQLEALARRANDGDLEAAEAYLELEARGHL